jgi:NAD(P)-dependent dehydrogenase (short-subunit alcohol dehydrogenase family)
MDVSKLFSLEGRIALVTGGSRGIGRMIAEGFVAQGAKVYVSSRKAEACAETAHALGPRCIPLPQDIATVAGCEALAQALAAHESRLDILVNNAGAAWGVEFDAFPEKGWDKVMDLNVKSPFFLTQKLHGLLKAAATAERPAKVINIGSIDGMRLNPWETYSYHASKAAILYLTRRLAARLVRDRIHVTAIAPGAFASEMNRAARDHGDEVARSIPARRIGQPEDMAAAAIYLASRAGDYVVGDTLTVDGGLVYAALGSSIDAEAAG